MVAARWWWTSAGVCRPMPLWWWSWLLICPAVFKLLSEDWWPYGVEKNRKAVDTFLRYHHEQGLSQHLLRSEDIFVPDLLDT